MLHGALSRRRARRHPAQENKRVIAHAHSLRRLVGAHVGRAACEQEVFDSRVMRSYECARVRTHVH
jgi:hypothetical protein